MEFSGKVVVITGAAQGIGKALAERLAKEGAIVASIDRQEGCTFVGDLASKEVLDTFASQVKKQYEHVDILINNAAPLFKGIDECTYEEFSNALQVGVTAAFYLTKLFLPVFSSNASVINISSTRDRMSQAQSESYSAAKGGISALTHALAVSLAGKVRVNSISPGWIDTDYRTYDGSDAAQHPSGRVGNPDDIVETVLFLSSEKSTFINGENITVDGGMSKLMVYHGDKGWHLNI